MIALVVGGAASGKSVVAERLALTLPAPVTYLATWVPSDDEDMRSRVAAHRARRPSTWALREVATDLAAELRSVTGTALVDSLGTWVAGVPGFAVDADGVCAALRTRAGDTVVVSDEVGAGVHPETAAGREFRDVLGGVNQAVAAVADQAWLVVAGRVVALDVPTWVGA